MATLREIRKAYKKQGFMLDEETANRAMLELKRRGVETTIKVRKNEPNSIRLLDRAIRILGADWPKTGGRDDDRLHSDLLDGTTTEDRERPDGVSVAELGDTGNPETDGLKIDGKPDSTRPMQDDSLSRRNPGISPDADDHLRAISGDSTTGRAADNSSDNSEKINDFPDPDGDYSTIVGGAETGVYCHAPDMSDEDRRHYFAQSLRNESIEIARTLSNLIRTVSPVEPSRKFSGRGIVTELTTSRLNMLKARKLESDKGLIMICADNSPSCEESADMTCGAAMAIARAYNNCVCVLHSNGEPNMIIGQKLHNYSAEDITINGYEEWYGGCFNSLQRAFFGTLQNDQRLKYIINIGDSDSDRIFKQKLVAPMVQITHINKIHKKSYLRKPMMIYSGKDTKEELIEGLNVAACDYPLIAANWRKKR